MMLQMVLQRIGIGFATLIAVSIIVFIGTSILPGDVAQIILGQSATPETLAVMREQLGLNDPAYIRYFSWLGNMLNGDLGISKAGGASIASLIGGRLGNTMVLAGMVAVIAVPLSVALGLYAAMHPGTWLDRIVTFGTLSTISVPEFFIATVLVLVFAVLGNCLIESASEEPESKCHSESTVEFNPTASLWVVI